MSPSVVSQCGSLMLKYWNKCWLWWDRGFKVEEHILCIASVLYVLRLCTSGHLKKGCGLPGIIVSLYSLPVWAEPSVQSTSTSALVAINISPDIRLQFTTPVSTLYTRGLNFIKEISRYLHININSKYQHHKHWQVRWEMMERLGEYYITGWRKGKVKSKRHLHINMRTKIF